MRATVGFDESGNTGGDLLNAEQPVFVLASVGLSDAACVEILGPPDSVEHHWISARRSARGRAWILETLNSDRLGSETVKVAVMHKRFMVTAKIVDILVEPIVARAGYDLYRDGAHLALTNLLHLVWPVSDPSGAESLAVAFTRWARQPSSESAVALSEAIRPMAMHAPDGVQEALLMAADVLSTDHTAVAGPPDMSDLDPAGPALVALLQDWAIEIGSFDAVHDDSREIRRWKPYIADLCDPSHSPVDVQLWNGEHLRYPLPVGEITLPSSEQSAQIQMADLVAGAAATAFGSLVKTPPPTQQQFVDGLLESRLSEWIVGASLWPTRDMTPEQLGVEPGATPWPIDRLIGH